jgi:hypothetical protein
MLSLKPHWTVNIADTPSTLPAACCGTLQALDSSKYLVQLGSQSTLTLSELLKSIEVHEKPVGAILGDIIGNIADISVQGGLMVSGEHE